ncbi:MAG: MoaD/ThiS family protein [Anaerolineales bacterium]|nr:MoaD/ThiS family protein [Anaerolineales bacterium]
MDVQVLLFATLRERAGRQRSIQVNLPDGATVADLKQAIRQAYPALQASLATVIVSVNHEFAFDPDVLPPDPEVALFPPVSGG